MQTGHCSEHILQHCTIDMHYFEKPQHGQKVNPKPRHAFCKTAQHTVPRMPHHGQKVDPIPKNTFCKTTPTYSECYAMPDMPMVGSCTFLVFGPSTWRKTSKSENTSDIWAITLLSNHDKVSQSKQLSKNWSTFLKNKQWVLSFFAQEIKQEKHMVGLSRFFPSL